jgi:hypothetical protein
MTRHPSMTMADFVVDYGRDQNGQWVWKCDARGVYGGPFASQAEAEHDSEVTLLGAECRVTECGEWDPAWDQPQ